MKLTFNKKQRRKVIGIRITEDEYNQIEKLAKLYGVTLAEVGHELIACSLKKCRKQNN